jgi:hypothetical protein
MGRDGTGRQEEEEEEEEEEDCHVTSRRRV